MTSTPSILRRTTPRGWAITAYCVAVIAFMAASGIPFDRESVILIIVGGLLVANVGRTWREVARVLFDWLRVLDSAIYG